MIVFKLYFKLLKKNKGMIFIYILIFIAMMTMFLKTNGSNSMVFANRQINMALIDNDKTEFTESFKQYLDDYAVFIDVEEKDLDEALFYRKISFILTIPSGFTEKFISDSPIELKYRSIPDSTQSYMIKQQIDKYLNLANIYLTNDLNTSNLNEAIKNILNKEANPVFLEAETIDNSITNLYFNFAAYLIMILLITIIGTIMLSFKPIDVKRRNDIGMISNRKMNLILLIANLTFGLILLFMIMLASIILFGEQMFTKNGLVYLLNIFLFSLSTIALAYLIATIFNSINIIIAIGTVFSLGGAFITGIFIPQFLLDKNILQVAKIFPSYWYVAVNDNIAYNLQNNALIEGIIAQISFLIIFIIIALLISKKRQRNEI